MQLEQLQTNLCSLIKMRSMPGGQDAYINEISSSSNLRLVRKIALWWRQIQIENSCVMTANLLKQKGIFEEQLSLFFSDVAYSPFREEVYLQFLTYIASKKSDSLIESVAEFETALIRVKLGERIETSIPWDYNPYEVIQGLLKGNVHETALEKNKCCTHVSYQYKNELFRVMAC